MMGVAAVILGSSGVLMIILGERTDGGTTDAAAAMVMKMLTAADAAPTLASTSISLASPAPLVLDVNNGREQGRPPGARKRNDESRR